jgi:DtxR family transcriptional regulator, Mn-dependent transcriptional regulator
VETVKRHRAVEVEATEAIEDYVKAIYSLQHGGEEEVSTSALAERLGVTPGSASGMVKKLASLGLADHVPYRGVVLTRLGRRLALEVLRHHRLLELYLSEAFGMPWDQVHAEAEVLEHVLSEELEELIAAKLGDPRVDPHGDPIPGRDGSIDEPRTRSLADLSAGDRGLFIRVSDSNPEMLRYLAERKIRPGEELEVTGRQPFGGPIFVRIAGTEHALGGALARAMRVALPKSLSQNPAEATRAR